MSSREAMFASAGRFDQLRSLTSSEARELEEHRRVARELVAAHRVDDVPLFRLLIVGSQVLDGFEHGVAGEATLCGLPVAELFVMRHLFYANGRFACPACAAAVRPAER